MTTNDGPDSIRGALSPLVARARRLTEPAQSWLADSGNLRAAAAVLFPLLLAAGLLLPPLSLLTRLTTLDYHTVRPGADVSVPSDPPGARLDLSRHDVARTTRIRLRTEDGPPRGADELPAGYALVGPLYRLDIRGPLPRRAWLDAPMRVAGDQQAYVDPYGWDGLRWRWLSPEFVAAERVRVLLPLSEHVPDYIALTLATAASTEVSAVLLDPPAVVPAAVAELPILEMRAYHLHSDDGSVRGRPFAVPAGEARMYGVLDNREGARLRTDLINNVLIVPQSRQRHREAIVGLAQRDRLSGVVLDYQGIAPDLQLVYADQVKRLATDLHRIGAELIVVIPMPHRTASGWNGSPYQWRALGAAADGLRVRLPNDAPLETEVLDSMVRWASERVNRRRLQLALPVRGRDIVDGEVELIGFGEALGRILDVAESDAPGNITPGDATEVELPAMRAAELARDPGTGMWHFYYWDANRRRHSVWLNDATGLQPAFEVASRYRLARIALDGVEAGLDPALWRMVRAYIERGEASAAESSYRLSWQLVDDRGRVVQEAIQSVDDPVFRFQAPREEGPYRLAVNLVGGDGRIVAIGDSSPVQVGPPPPAPPTATPNVIRIPPTPESIITAPPPADERFIGRTPVAAATVATVEAGIEHDAEIAFAKAELRDGPGFQYEVISDLRPGQRLAVAARSRDMRWLQVRLLATGMEGWVLAELLDVSINLAGVAIATPVPSSTP